MHLLTTCIVPKLIIFFILGIIAAYYFQISIIAIFIFMFFSLISAVYFFCKRKNTLFLITMFMFLFSFGTIWTLSFQLQGNTLRQFNNSQQMIAGMVKEYKYKDYGHIYRVTDITIGNRGYEGDISLLVVNPETKYRYGDIIRFKGSLREHEAPRNPGEFNFKKYLEDQGIILQTVAQGENIKWLKREGKSFLRILFDWRDNAIKVIDKVLKKREAAILQTMLLGDRNSLSNLEREIFIQFGIMHFLAISGFHVGFILAFILAVCHVFKLNKILQFFITSGALFFYALITGFSAPVVRASIMAIFYLITKLTREEYRIQEGISIAAFCILLYNPMLLFTASFQLTFIATIGIVYLTPVFEVFLKKLLSQEAIVKIFSVSFAAFTAATPLVLYYFYRISFLGPFISVVLTPFIGAIIVLGSISFFILPFLPLLSEFLIFIAGGIIFFILESLSFLKNLFSPAAIWLPRPNLLLLLVIYLFLIVTFILYRNRENPKIFLFTLRNKKKLQLGLLFIIIIALFFSLQTEELVITFLDVGQGDAIHIKTPAGKHILIDGGNRTKYKDIGKDVVIPYLRYLGVTKLDVIINSHPDSDHLGGLYSVIKEVSTQLVLMPDILHKERYNDFLNFLKKRGVEYKFVNGGNKLNIDEKVNIEFLYPPPDSNLSANNSSLVLKVSHGSNDFLFTGDIERDAQWNLINCDNLASEIIKIPHHGSNDAFNNIFLQRVQPQVAIISVGVQNPFGHPGDEVIAWAARNNVKLYTTSDYGAITVRSNGRKLKIYTHLSH